MNHGLVIPTRGDHPDLLDALIDASGIPAERIALVSNDSTYTHRSIAVIHDLGPVNIQRWWNTGIDALQRRGCTTATVLNDDTTIDAGRLDDLSDALHTTGATLAHPGQPGHHVGWAWCLNLAHPVRPDEAYRWWYGDDQLYRDAMHAHGVVAVPEVVIGHWHHNASTTASPELQELAKQDRRLWYG